MCKYPPGSPLPLLFEAKRWGLVGPRALREAPADGLRRAGGTGSPGGRGADANTERSAAAQPRLCCVPGRHLTSTLGQWHLLYSGF